MCWFRRGMAICLVLLGGCNGSTGDSGSVSPGAMPQQTRKGGVDLPIVSAVVRDFLGRHWPEQIPPQGPPPASFSPLEASLAPEDCGHCHVAQFKDWQGSRHSTAMGPGILGQLVDMDLNDPEQARMCRSCHTPLAEQQAGADPIVPFLSGDQLPGAPGSTGPHGLTCAGCHVRQHHRYGPPRSVSSTVSAAVPSGANLVDGAALPHGGFSAEPAFLDAAFCKECHQFEPDGYALNGKLLENTYQEWRASDYARKGVSCQGCHMPGRQHLWRGIHDREMVKKAISVQVSIPQPVSKKSEILKALIKIRNVGAGHYFPSYATPRVIVRSRLIDADGQVLPGTSQQAIIARELSLDLQEEIFDTRIPPHERSTLVYEQRLPIDRAELLVEIRVEPDHFYSRFYQSMLQQDLSGQAEALIQSAAKTAADSGFSVYRQSFSLQAGGDVVAGQDLKQALPPHQSNKDIKQARTVSPGIDWNDDQISWQSYAAGLALARQEKRPIMLIFYADWCPTCHAYRHIFSNANVLAASRGLVMVRVNVDREPGLSRRYAGEGDIVPRSFLLTADGEMMADVDVSSGGYRHFLRADDPEAFVRVMQQALKQG